MILTVQSDIVHHFEDDTNLLNYNDLQKRMNKQVNQGLKDLINWSNSNKNYLYISKTDVVSFKLSANLTNVPLKLKVSGN